MRGRNRVWHALGRARAMNLAESGGPNAAGGNEVTRRRVLAAIGGGMAAAALPRWPAFAQTPPRIVIVGGGLAGLSALDTLRRDRGVEAELYEARAAVGGRTRSVQGVFASEYAFDEGAQLVNSDHADLLRLIYRFGLPMVGRQGFGPAEEIQIGRSGSAVPEARLAAGLRGIAARIAADSARLEEDYETVSRELDRLSVRDYLDRHRMPPGDARDALEATMRTEYGAEPEEASALELIFNLPSVDGAEVSRLGNSDELYLVSGGTDQIAHRLAVEHEAHIHLGKRLDTLDMTGAAVRLAFADGSRVEADRVILALPAPLLREVRIDGPLPPLWRALIDEVRLGRNEKLIVGYDIQPWRRHPGFGGAIWAARHFSEVWDAASMAPAPGPGALCYFLGGAQVDAAAAVPNRELAARFTAAARRVIPGLPEPNGRIRRTRWCEDPLTKGAYANFLPGQMTRFASLFTIEESNRVRASQAGPLLFAGEWLSVDWPGFMNGAVQTGRIAAEAALAPAAALAA